MCDSQNRAAQSHHPGKRSRSQIMLHALKGRLKRKEPSSGEASAVAAEAPSGSEIQTWFITRDFLRLCFRFFPIGFIAPVVQIILSQLLPILREFTDSSLSSLVLFIEIPIIAVKTYVRLTSWIWLLTALRPTPLRSLQFEIPYRGSGLSPSRGGWHV